MGLRLIDEPGLKAECPDAVLARRRSSVSSSCESSTENSLALPVCEDAERRIVGFFGVRPEDCTEASCGLRGWFCIEPIAVNKVR